MTLTTITTLAGLAASGAIAWSLGGRVGTGVIAGYIAGAFVSGLALIAQRRLNAMRPELLAASVMASFVIKAFAMLALVLAVRYVAPLAAVADAPAFLFGFGGATLLVLGPATFETLRTLDARRNAPVARVGEARPS